MKKKSIILMVILTAGVMLSSAAVHLVHAHIDSSYWLGTMFYYDPFWDSNYVTVFPEGTLATLRVSVHNSFVSTQLNVSAVKVWMDWNTNYSSTECSESAPFAMLPDTYQTFTVTFTVPDVSVASNLIKHGYTIYVDQTNATEGTEQVWNHDRDSATGFIVYSTGQLEAERLYDQLDLLTSHTYSFQSYDAEALWDNGTEEFGAGQSSHWSGDFAAAKTHYESALSLFNQALSAEASYQSYWESDDRRTAELQNLLIQAQIDQAAAYARYYDGQVEYYKGQAEYYKGRAVYEAAQANTSLIEANASMRQADAAMRQADAAFALQNSQGIAYILFGFGFIVFGIAAVVWAFRRPRPPQPPI